MNIWFPCRMRMPDIAPTPAMSNVDDDEEKVMALFCRQSRRAVIGNQPMLHTRQGIHSMSILAIWRSSAVNGSDISTRHLFELIQTVWFKAQILMQIRSRSNQFRKLFSLLFVSAESADINACGYLYKTMTNPRDISLFLLCQNGKLAAHQTDDRLEFFWSDHVRYLI